MPLTDSSDNISGTRIAVSHSETKRILHASRELDYKDMTDADVQETIEDKNQYLEIVEDKRGGKMIWGYRPFGDRPLLTHLAMEDMTAEETMKHFLTRIRAIANRIKRFEWETVWTTLIRNRDAAARSSPEFVKTETRRARNGKDYIRYIFRFDD